MRRVTLSSDHWAGAIAQGHHGERPHQIYFDRCCENSFTSLRLSARHASTNKTVGGTVHLSRLQAASIHVGNSAHIHSTLKILNIHTVPNLLDTNGGMRPSPHDSKNKYFAVEKMAESAAVCVFFVTRVLGYDLWLVNLAPTFQYLFNDYIRKSQFSI